MRLGGKLVVAAVLATAALSCNRSSGETVLVGIAIPSYVHGLAWIAAESGSFKAAGVETRVDVMGGSAATARSLLAGSTHVGLLGGDAVVKANAAGGDLVVIGGLVNRFYHRLIGRKGIGSMTELRGKKIGLPFLGGPQDMAVRFSLKKSGLAYGDDVEIFNLGREMNRMAALSGGDIDATTSQTPPEQLAKLGYVVLDDLPSQNVAFPYMMVVVKRSYLSSHRQRVRMTLLGLCRATVFYRDNRDQSLAHLQKHLHGSDTAKAAAMRYAHSGPSQLSWPPVPDPRGFEMVLAFLGSIPGDKSGGQKPADVIDTGILDELRDSGECGGR